MKTKEEFIDDCLNEFCNRRNLITPSCFKLYKQEGCYKKMEKIYKDREYKKSNKEARALELKNNLFEKFDIHNIPKDFETFKIIFPVTFITELDFNNFVEQLKYNEFRSKVWIQDCGFFANEVKRSDWRNWCKFWNILSQEEKQFVELNDKNELDIAFNLDVCHIIEKSDNIDLKYNPDNAVVGNRLMHHRLDNLYHPVYDIKISKEDRLLFLRSAKDFELTNKII